MDPETYELFVPGRLCLFGEHSDWSGQFRCFNSEIGVGYTVVLGTRQGLYARARKHDRAVLAYTAVDEHGALFEKFECPMERGALLQKAREGGFFSYVCSVAYVAMTNHLFDGGISVDQYRTTLPLRKGLSSSAAACVLVARALNRCYNLRLSTRGEMEMAYLGERCTPSTCGRMDQACAFGPRPTLLSYDGDILEVEPVRVKAGHIFRLIIVDLGQEKDTPLMLSSLQRTFHAPGGDKKVQEWLGPVNTDLTKRALAHLIEGDDAALGGLMSEAMANFDFYGAPTCPSQFDAPVLHAVLRDEHLKALTYGGKSIGCGGEGSCQFVARSEAARVAALEYITSELNMWCCAVDLSETSDPLLS